MNTFLHFLEQAWWLTAQMSPWLLFGFLIAGVCGQIIPPQFIEKHLSKPTIGSILKAVVIGIPLPICSCGVIPISASLSKQGASKGAVAAFTAATPQTGIDSIAATYSLMGWGFTIARIIANLISGVLAGVLINLLGKEPPQDIEPKSCCCSQKKEAPEKPSCCSSQPIRKNPLLEALRDGFIKLPADLAKYLTLGILIGALISALVPANAMETWLQAPLFSYAVVTLIATPLYVCATGSIPLAFALLHAGVSPGVALVFLITGPATNTATLLTLIHILGKKETLIYLLTIIFGAWIVAYGFDMWLPETLLPATTHTHENTPSILEHSLGILLVFITTHALWRKKTNALL